MYLTIHGTAALLIAQAVPNPLAAFVLGLATHAALDVIPHGDEHIIHPSFTRKHTLRRVIGAAGVDGIVLLMFVGIYLFTTPGTATPAAAWALAGALLPDLLQGIYFATQTKTLKWFNDVHITVHNATGHHLHWTQGFLVQGLVLTALWLALL